MRGGLSVKLALCRWRKRRSMWSKVTPMQGACAQHALMLISISMHPWLRNSTVCHRLAANLAYKCPLPHISRTCRCSNGLASLGMRSPLASMWRTTFWTSPWARRGTATQATQVGGWVLEGCHPVSPGCHQVWWFMAQVTVKCMQHQSCAIRGGLLLFISSSREVYAQPCFASAPVLTPPSPCPPHSTAHSLLTRPSSCQGAVDGV